MQLWSKASITNGHPAITVVVLRIIWSTPATLETGMVPVKVAVGVQVEEGVRVQVAVGLEVALKRGEGVEVGVSKAVAVQVGVAEPEGRGVKVRVGVGVSKSGGIIGLIVPLHPKIKLPKTKNNTVNESFIGHLPGNPNEIPLNNQSFHRVFYSMDSERLIPWILRVFEGF